MDDELQRMLYDLEDTFEECQFYINQIKQFKSKKIDIKTTKFNNKLSFGRLNKVLIYQIIFTRALRDKLEKNDWENGYRSC
jgi:hypothetical protein